MGGATALQPSTATTTKNALSRIAVGNFRASCTMPGDFVGRAPRATVPAGNRVACGPEGVVFLPGFP
jgi:hypothetical protein